MDEKKITDAQNALMRAPLVLLAKRNKFSIENYSWYIDSNIWAVNIYDNRMAKTLCLVCGEIITDDKFNVMAVRYHGFLHLKEKNLITFL